MRLLARAGRAVSALALVATATAALVVAGPEPAGAVPCPTYWVIGVRGSGEGFVGPYGMGNTVGVYVESAASRLPAGEVEYTSLAYPASSVGPGYFDSVAYGASVLRSTIRSRIAQCPGTRIGVVGYSQGAHVINDGLRGLSNAELGYVRAVLQIADPRSDPGPSYHIETDIYGRQAPRGTYGGVLTAQALPSAVHSRATDYCFVEDLVCDASNTGLDNLARAVTLSFHGGYRTCCNYINMVSVLGTSFANRMKAAWTPPATPPPPQPPQPPPTPGSLAVKRNDYTRDGVSDLVAIRNGDGCIARWRGNGNGGLDYFGDYGCGWDSYTELTSVGDINNDGVGDVVAVRKSDGCLGRWKGNGNGGLDYIGDYGCGWNNYTELTGVGDINKDGVGDLVAVRKSDGCIARWKGNGNGGLDYIGDYGCGWGNYTSLAGMGDLTRDNVGDLVGVRKSDGCIARWRGNGNGGLDYMGDYGCGWGSYSQLT
jgi:hypothetical protein